MTYTTTKIYDGTYTASSSAAAATGVHGIGETRSKAIADLCRQIRARATNALVVRFLTDR